MLAILEFSRELQIDVHIIIAYMIKIRADISGHVVKDVSLRPFGFTNFGFDSRRIHECLSLVSVECC